MKGSTFSSSDVQKIAALARIPITDEQAQDLADGFTKTMGIIDQLNTIEVNDTRATSQVTGLENVMREDEIDTTRMFTQEEALSNAKRTHNGYFVVDQILED